MKVNSDPIPPTPARPSAVPENGLSSGLQLLHGSYKPGRPGNRRAGAGASAARAQAQKVEGAGESADRTAPQRSLPFRLPGERWGLGRPAPSQTQH